MNQYFSPLQCGSHHVRLCNSFNAAKWIIFICKQKNTLIDCPRRSEIVIFLMIVRDHRECYQKKKSLSRLENDLKRRVNYNNNLLLPFTQQCLGYPKGIVKRVFTRPRGNTILTPNFAHKRLCSKQRKKRRQLNLTVQRGIYNFRKNEEPKLQIKAACITYTTEN